MKNRLIKLMRAIVLATTLAISSAVTFAAQTEQYMAPRYTPNFTVNDNGYIISTEDWIDTYLGLTDFKLLSGKLIEGGRVIDKGNISIKIQTADGNYVWVNLLNEDKWYPFLWQPGTEVQLRVYEKVTEPGTYVGAVFKFKYKDLDPIQGLEYSSDENKKDKNRVNITYAQKEGLSKLMSAQQDDMMTVFLKDAKVVDELKDGTLIIKNTQGLYIRYIPPYANSLNSENINMRHYKKGDSLRCYAYLPNGYYNYHGKNIFSIIDTRSFK